MIVPLSSSLAATFGSLVRHHVATPAQPLSPPSPGITWVWAANGIWKRGVDRHLDALIRVHAAPVVPGLAYLLPHVRWSCYDRRLPVQLLHGILLHARKAAQVTTSGLALPIEQQYHIVYDREQRTLRATVPPQEASTARVRYAMPPGAVLLDLHSHHQMPSYFSSTDDRDDTGLSVSAVIGEIFMHPTICCRINVYGHRQRVPALALFDGLGPFVDTLEGHDDCVDD